MHAFVKEKQVWRQQILPKINLYIVEWQKISLLWGLVINLCSFPISLYKSKIWWYWRKSYIIVQSHYKFQRLPEHNKDIHYLGQDTNLLDFDFHQMQYSTTVEYTGLPSSHETVYKLYHMLSLSIDVKTFQMTEMLPCHQTKI
jgi:hypothetical protein